MFIPYVGLDLWTAVNEGGGHAPFVFLWAILSPAIYLSGMVWFSPWAWQKRFATPSFARRLAFALLAAQTYMLASLVIESTLQYAAGHPFVLLPRIPVLVVFHAPGMTLVGGVLAARESLGRANEELQAQAREAQTKALQGQLHPHVLFNALNGLAELIHRDPNEAEESVRHLSNLLRRILKAADAPGYTLQEEREILEEYLSMERYRLGKRLRVAWAWDKRLDALRLPPLLLQPLVENALRHGISPSRSGGDLLIEAAIEADQATLRVKNTGIPLVHSGNSGGASIGLLNLRSRLELAYGGTALFSLKSEAGWTVAELQLPRVSSIPVDTP
jgi:hypothetical protein